MLQLTTKNDTQVHQDVRDELQGEPHLEERAIDVTVSHGTVTLAGVVPHLAAHDAAEQAARRVLGVLAVTNRIGVRPPLQGGPSDEELRSRIDHILAWNALIAPRKLRTTCEAGRVVLEGTVPLWSDRATVESALRSLAGVREIENRIEVRPDPVDDDALRRAIEAAVERRSFCNSQRIRVLVHDGEVVLCGTVRSPVEQASAMHAAAAATGVRTLRNALEVDPYA